MDCVISQHSEGDGFLGVGRNAGRVRRQEPNSLFRFVWANRFLRFLRFPRFCRVSQTLLELAHQETIVDSSTGNHAFYDGKFRGKFRQDEIPNRAGNGFGCQRRRCCQSVTQSLLRRAELILKVLLQIINSKLFPSSAFWWRLAKVELAE